MKISVILPCYNAETYLPACLRSLRAQTMDDFEALLVDDGSQDGTRALLTEAAAADGRFRLLCQANAGVSAARNRALAEAKGEWVFFLDADDLLPADALQTLLSAADAQTDLVVGTHTVFSEAGEARVLPEGGWTSAAGERRRHLAALRLIEGDSVLNIMCNKLHRRALLEREGLRLLEGLRVAEDNLFNLQAVLLGRGIAFVPQETYRYRMHAGSAMHRQTDTQYGQHLPWLRALGALLRGGGWMETYYGAYLDSVTLRLYKDGGVPGVVRNWQEKALPLVRMEGLDVTRMSARDRRVYGWVHSGLYPRLYPAIAVGQILRRKLQAITDRGRGG